MGKGFWGGLVSGIVLAAVGVVNLEDKFLKRLAKEKRIAGRNDALYQTMNLWCMSMQKGKHIKTFFEEHGYYNIAIYGMGYMGERVYDELLNTGIHVKYAIDKSAEYILTTPKIFRPDQALEKVDAVVVTAIYYFDEIKKELESKMGCPVISLRDVIKEIL